MSNDFPGELSFSNVSDTCEAVHCGHLCRHSLIHSFVWVSGLGKVQVGIESGGRACNLEIIGGGEGGLTSRSSRMTDKGVVEEQYVEVSRKLRHSSPWLATCTMQPAR